MKKQTRFLALGLILCSLAWSVPGIGSPLTATRRFVELLPKKQVSSTVFPLNDSDRYDWEWTPGGRMGLSLKEMSPQLRNQTQTILKSLLSQEGYRKVNAVLERESVLARIENSSHRDPERYYLAIYGKPAEKTLWALRFEGHHLSLNFTLLGSKIVSVTPLVIGSNPATILSGKRKGERLLAKEVDLAKELVKSFSPGQRKKAVLGNRFIGGMRWGNFSISRGKSYKAERLRGLEATEFNANQKKLIVALAKEYVDLVHPSFGQTYIKKHLSNPEELRFAWRGTLSGKDRYFYRIQGKAFVIEHNAVQDKGNHIHAVWRDANTDFGAQAISE